MRSTGDRSLLDRAQASKNSRAPTPTPRMVADCREARGRPRTIGPPVYQRNSHRQQHLDSVGGVDPTIRQLGARPCRRRSRTYQTSCAASCKLLHAAGQPDAVGSEDPVARQITANELSNFWPSGTPQPVTASNPRCALYPLPGVGFAVLLPVVTSRDDVLPTV
jgi:hypothetical protein